MRKFVSPAFVIVLIAGLALTGCATKQYVQEQVQNAEGRTDTKLSEVQSSVESNQAEITKLHQKDQELEKKLAELSETAKDALQRAQEAGKLAKGKFLYEVTLTDNDTRFGFDKYRLSDEAKAALDDFAKGITNRNAAVYIEIQGHTDNIGSEEYNLALGFRRAEQVMRYLNMEHAFPLHRMNVISYGEYKPLVDNDSPENRAKNRRVTLVVME